MEESDKIDPRKIADETHVPAGDVQKVLQELEPDYLFESYVLRRNETPGQLVADLWRFYPDVANVEHRRGNHVVVVYMEGNPDDLPRSMHNCIEKHGFALKREFHAYYNEETDCKEFVLTPDKDQ